MDGDDEDLRRALRMREHVVVAVDKTLHHRVEVVTIAGDADDGADALRTLMEVFGFDDLQAHAVLDMQIRRMSREERQRITDELASLRHELDKFG